MSVAYVCASAVAALCYSGSQSPQSWHPGACPAHGYCSQRIFFWSWRKAKQDGHQYLLGICCLNRRGFLWGQRRYRQPECSPWSLLSHGRWVLCSGARLEVVLSCLSLSATLDFAVWSTSLEAGVVIVPFERLWTWAPVYECLACLFQVGF